MSLLMLLFIEVTGETTMVRLEAIMTPYNGKFYHQYQDRLCLVFEDEDVEDEYHFL